MSDLLDSMRWVCIYKKNHVRCVYIYIDDEVIILNNRPNIVFILIIYIGYEGTEKKTKI